MGAIQLIRHGQASWGAADYDQLSQLGTRQAAALGASWDAGGYRPSWSVAGSMKRHAQTAVAALDEIDGDLYDVNDGWDEYDHMALVAALGSGPGTTGPREFQAMLDRALADWISGRSDASGESFAQFEQRVRAAFDQAVAAAISGQRIAVFTSGGPIGLVASHLLAGDASLFQTLNRVVVNASVTTVIVGSAGSRLLSFNEHTHLPSSWHTFR